ncbi:MAG TPA: phospholipid carrier-dependent glycosyltransferase, partial [Vicinamibacterales bacterium]|nr:phospholipid carrier-dependent glycosyltransferase [Vicinamibacterales bacterium]
MSSRIALLAVLAVAAALRFWNIGTGLPYRIGPDEPVIAEHAIGMMRTGNFNPRFYDYPGLVIYVHLFVGCLTFVTGAMSGLWRSVSEFHPEHLFLWTRMLNASIGTLTVLLLYSAGMRWGRWVALTAAALLAVWPNHVRESHFALTDVPLTFLTTSTFLLSLRAYESGRLWWWLGAGAAAGLASASKYSGAYAVML